MAKIDPAFEALIQHGLTRFEAHRAGIDRQAKEADKVIEELREQLLGLANFGTTFPQGLLEQTDIMAVGRLKFSEYPHDVHNIRLQTDNYHSGELITVIGRGVRVAADYDCIVIFRKAVRRG